LHIINKHIANHYFPKTWIIKKFINKKNWKKKRGEYQSETRGTRIATLSKNNKEQQNHGSSRKVPK
jgi:ABC-type ATPase with predicted acetyltransferase domain